jgi:queuine/archaeosine tRNA-ribosyltransferase
LTLFNVFRHNQKGSHPSTFLSILINLGSENIIMQDAPLQDSATDPDYQAGYQRTMRFAERARQQGWQFSDRRLVHEIIQHERAAYIREKSSLPIVGPQARSAAWNHGRADALRELLRTQRIHSTEEE